MKPAPISAPPDLMALLCLMGGAVRDAGELNLMMQLLVIGSLCPSFGVVLQMWLAAEERAGATKGHDGIWFLEVEGDDEDQYDDDDEVTHGWTRRQGPLLLWRHVTRFGTVMTIPIECAWLQRRDAQPSPVLLCGLLLPISPYAHARFFLLGLPELQMLVQFVTIS